MKRAGGYESPNERQERLECHRVSTPRLLPPQSNAATSTATSSTRTKPPTPTRLLPNHARTTSLRSNHPPLPLSKPPRTKRHRPAHDRHPGRTSDNVQPISRYSAPRLTTPLVSDLCPGPTHSVAVVEPRTVPLRTLFDSALFHGHRLH